MTADSANPQQVDRTLRAAVRDYLAANDALARYDDERSPDDPQSDAADAEANRLWERAIEARARLDEFLAASPSSFQARVKTWLLACFGPAIAADRLERQDRALEEVLELLQSLGYPLARIAALADYVYGRSVGDPHQELGGVMVTLASLSQAIGLDMHEAGEAELARVTRPEVISKIRVKQAAKPTGSALPILATPPAPDSAGSATPNQEDSHG